MADASRLAEKKEADWWERRGWIVERAWKEARYVGKSRVVAVPRDFFGHYDVLALKPRHGVGIQVSLREIRSNRSAHGPPLFGSSPPMTVEAFACAERADNYPAGFFEVLASYHGEETTREWWSARPKRARKQGLDLYGEL